MTQRKVSRKIRTGGGVGRVREEAGGLRSVAFSVGQDY